MTALAIPSADRITSRRPVPRSTKRRQNHPALEKAMVALWAALDACREAEDVEADSCLTNELPGLVYMLTITTSIFESNLRPFPALMERFERES